MSVAFECEAMFNRADELASSVTALGEMLEWAPEEVKQSTLVAVGRMLRTMGVEISAISGKYVEKTFHELCALQEDASKVITATPDISADVAPFDSPEGRARLSLVAAAFIAQPGSLVQEKEGKAL